MQHADHDMVNDWKSPHFLLIISIIFYSGVRNSEPYIRSETSSYFDIQKFLFLFSQTTSEIEVQLTEEMIRVADWLKENDLIINLNKGKTETMVFGSSRNVRNKSLEFYFNAKVINFTTVYLGVLIDQAVNLNEHFV